MNISADDSALRQKVGVYLWLTSCVLSVAYLAGAMARSDLAFVALADLPQTVVIAWKGVSELLLVTAVWAVASVSSRKLAISITLIFLADMVLALGKLYIAGGLFIVAHLLAAYAYSQRRETRQFEWLGFVPLALVLLLVAWSIATAKFQVIVLFPLFSALLAFCALRSAYPPMFNGLGSVVFWLSDFIFVVAIILTGDATQFGWIIWLTFATGLLLIVLGIRVEGLQKIDSGIRN